MFLLCNRIGKKHVSEIATMALDLLDASSFFKVPRRYSHYTHITEKYHKLLFIGNIIEVIAQEYNHF